MATSRSLGTLWMRTGPSARRAAASIGSTEFLAPETVSSPESGVPPRMASLSKVVLDQVPGSEPDAWDCRASSGVTARMVTAWTEPSRISSPIAS